MTQFSSQLLQKVRNFCNPVGNIPQPSDNDIMHRYLDNARVGFKFSMDYVGQDRMTLGGLLQPHSIELAKLVENFAVSIQSGKYVILNNSVFGSFLLLLVVVCLDQSLLIKIISLRL